MLLAALLLAQVTTTTGYLTDDPVTPGALGLALPSGRYSIQVFNRCGLSLASGQNVLVIRDDNGWTMIGDDREMCALDSMALMDATPCFVNADGVCDAAAEVSQ